MSNVFYRLLRLFKRRYVNKHKIKYHSPRYGKDCTVEKGFVSDGATWAIDIWSEGWWVHDKLCQRCAWDDKTPVTNLQASLVLFDILWAEKRFIRALYWMPATFIGGGWNIKRKVGWW